MIHAEERQAVAAEEGVHPVLAVALAREELRELDHDLLELHLLGRAGADDAEEQRVQQLELARRGEQRRHGGLLQRRRDPGLRAAVGGQASLHVLLREPPQQVPEPLDEVGV
eukprot:CAMPEP_0118866532 /NCGR_PEP_ID=MMETSP1163-20130328/10413_1 /TAXON_ID=124430 /ORGANISM="Phaeomonas parva, Strain CCMP2877" /LENGTH=111 /DNA_ID=CAMNT_0006800857 /DNA_START=269 /DNA_END=605 /DNA_ORIENTATION=-